VTGASVAAADAAAAIGCLVWLWRMLKRGSSNPAHCRLLPQVDVSESGHRWIFRSNFPKVKVNGTEEFAYPNPLLGWMQQRAKEEGGGKPFPSSFLLQDISFDNIFEFDDLQIETDWFKLHPEAGNITYWPLLGQFLPPEDVDPEQRAALVKDQAQLWALDQLPSRLATVRGWLMDESGPPTVYLWHCEAGCDRTGEVSGDVPPCRHHGATAPPAAGRLLRPGRCARHPPPFPLPPSVQFSGAYYMNYAGYNVSAAFARDTVECGRPPNYFSKSAIAWWCLSRESDGHPEGNCLSF